MLSPPKGHRACTTSRCAMWLKRWNGATNSSRWSWYLVVEPVPDLALMAYRQLRFRAVSGGSQVETTEAAAPIIVHQRRLIPDSGGAGHRRGGLGQYIEISSAIDQDFLLFLSVERVLNPAKGRHGGLDGAAGSIRIGDRKLPGKGEFRIRGHETLAFETPGGGGFGPPSQRAPGDLAHDVAAGLVSEKAAISLYGDKP